MDNDLFQFALMLAKKSGKYAYEKHDSIIVNHKGYDIRDLVTNVDIEIDEMLHKEILEKYPNHTIYSEESGYAFKDTEYTWSLDPIDGTSNYARSIPHYATSISLFKGDDICIGVVYNHATNECFAVDANGNVTLNEKSIKVSEVPRLSDAYVNFHPGRKKEYYTWAGSLKIALLKSAKKSLNLGASALDLCYVASGRMDIMIYGTLTTLDVAGALKILRAAGGELYNYKTKEPAKISDKPQQVIATNTSDLLKDFFKQIDI